MGKQIKSRVRQARLDHAARLGRVVSIREVSRETGISVSTLRRLEEDRAEGVDFSTLVRLAEFYGVARLDDLFEMTDDRRALRPVVGCDTWTGRRAKQSSEHPRQRVFRDCAPARRGWNGESIPALA